MDGSGQQVDMKARTEEIRQHMPETYRAIQAKAAEIGNLAYQLVREGIKGQANRFYAIERGRVVGTPFDLAVQAELAAYIVQFGCQHLVMWSPDAVKGANDGAH